MILDMIMVKLDATIQKTLDAIIPNATDTQFWRLSMR